ncbi:unnamed protein product [Lampetra planeri]
MRVVACSPSQGQLQPEPGTTPPVRVAARASREVPATGSAARIELGAASPRLGHSESDGGETEARRRLDARVPNKSAKRGLQLACE